MQVLLDAQDRKIVQSRIAALDQRERPRVGDFVRFKDGTTRRLSYMWPDGAQTSDGGSYYLGDGYVSMSGSLYPCVPVDSLTLTNETKDGRVWIFHHDWHTAGGGVDFEITFRVYRCDQDPPR